MLRFLMNSDFVYTNSVDTESIKMLLKEKFGNQVVLFVTENTDIKYDGIISLSDSSLDFERKIPIHNLMKLYFDDSVKVSIDDEFSGVIAMLNSEDIDSIKLGIDMLYRKKLNLYFNLYTKPKAKIVLDIILPIFRIKNMLPFEPNNGLPIEYIRKAKLIYMFNAMDFVAIKSIERLKQDNELDKII